MGKFKENFKKKMKKRTSHCGNTEHRGAKPTRATRKTTRV
jgi:hypothetical protein